jgi:hypothetical protein
MGIWQRVQPEQLWRVVAARSMSRFGSARRYCRHLAKQVVFGRQVVDLVRQHRDRGERACAPRDVALLNRKPTSDRNYFLTPIGIVQHIIRAVRAKIVAARFAGAWRRSYTLQTREEVVAPILDSMEKDQVRGKSVVCLDHHLARTVIKEDYILPTGVAQFEWHTPKARGPVSVHGGPVGADRMLYRQSTSEFSAINVERCLEPKRSELVGWVCRHGPILSRCRPSTVKLGSGCVSAKIIVELLII